MVMSPAEAAVALKKSGSAGKYVTLAHNGNAITLPGAKWRALIKTAKEKNGNLSFEFNHVKLEWKNSLGRQSQIRLLDANRFGEADNARLRTARNAAKKAQVVAKAGAKQANANKIMGMSMRFANQAGERKAAQQADANKIMGMSMRFASQRAQSDKLQILSASKKRASYAH